MDDVHPNTINDLLAIIHGDGGHYVEKHGMQEAVRRAAEIVLNERARKELEIRMNRDAFQSGFNAGRAEQGACNDQQAAKLERYETALKKIRNVGNLFSERIADEALYGEERAAQGIVRG